MDNEGSGLYFLQSHLNHSCVPNATVEFPFNNHELVVNAKERILPGEQESKTHLSP
jgi:SET domain-containing protein